MKLLLVLAVVLLGVWLWRSSRGQSPRAQAKANPAPSVAKPQDMVPCAYCGVHLPLADAQPGKAGVYCSDAHRQLAEH